MTLPKMILFDYGHTLLYEPGFDALRGTEAVLSYATSNPNNFSACEVTAFSKELHDDIGKCLRTYGVEIHNHIYQRLLYEYLEIETSLSKDEMETVFWDNAAPGTPMPNIEKLISYMNGKGIRSGVISNISFSEKALTERINRHLPDNRFEFVIASSEYVYRKPSKILFELALKKAHLKPEEVWFCGDNAQADIMGATAAGLLPVWYQSSLDCFYRDSALPITPDCEHIHITDWNELIDILNEAGAKPDPV